MRVGIVLTAFGIGSEIWALRQAEHFADFDPVYFAQTRREGGFALPEGRDLHLFGAPKITPLRRVRRKLGHAAGALPSRSYLAAMRQALLAQNLDVVLCHFAWNATAVQAAVGDILPVVCHVHGRDVTAHLRWPANQRALAAALPGFAAVITVGSHQLATLRGLWPDAQSHLIPCGAPLADFAAMPVPRRSPGTPIRFITVGRLSAEKGVLESLAAFEGVLAAGETAHLSFIGDGPLADTLRARIAARNLGAQVTLLGAQPTDAVVRHLAASHVYIQHSRAVAGSVEGFGVAVTEAGAAGLPVLVSRLGGLPDQVEDGASGILFAPDDVAAQTAAMLRLARNETLRRDMGMRARQVAQQFDSLTQTAKLEQVLTSVVSQTRSPAPM